MTAVCVRRATLVKAASYLALAAISALMLFPFAFADINGMQWAQYVHAVIGVVLTGQMDDGTAGLRAVLCVGAPLRRNGRLYNCALVLSRGRILGVVPKSFLPNYREYYEKRWFASGIGMIAAVAMGCFAFGLIGNLPTLTSPRSLACSSVRPTPAISGQV